MKFIALLSAVAAIHMHTKVHLRDDEDHSDEWYSAAEIGMAPPLITAQDQSGPDRDFESLRGMRGLSLMFSHSSNWSPHGKFQAVAWNRQIHNATKLGYKLASVTFNPVDKFAGFARRGRITYTLLSDKGSANIKAFGRIGASVPKTGHSRYEHT